MVFNLAGYRWLFNFIEEKAAARLEDKIATDQYSEDQLVEIRIPLDMPYYSDKGYENIYGETDWNGQHYRYVKRKISGNTLYLLCIPDTEKTAIASVKNEFTKAVNDVPANKQGSQQKNTLIKLLTTEFKITDLLVNGAFISALSHSFTNKNSSLTNLFIPLTEARPPEA